MDNPSVPENAIPSVPFVDGATPDAHEDEAKIMADELEYHEAANIFPLDEGTLDELAADIKKGGQLDPIDLYGGKILDGRRRYLACGRAGVEPTFRDVTATVTDPIAYSWSKNGPRRQMTPSQKAMSGGRMREMYEEQAKERQRQGGKTGGKGRPKQVPANLPDPNAGDTRDHVAKLVGVSGRTVDYATTVLRQAVPEVVQAVEEGRMAVSHAAILSAKPEKEQRAAATAPRCQRVYKSFREGNGTEEPEEDGGEGGEIKVRGVGVQRAHDAINCLRKIPRNDRLRKRGFQIVTDWIRHTLRSER